MNQAGTYKNKSDMLKEIRRRKISDAKSNIRIFFHTIFWRSLWFLGLARIYSRITCRLSIYKKFSDGRCMYCGKIKQTTASADETKGKDE